MKKQYNSLEEWYVAAVDDAKRHVAKTYKNRDGSPVIFTDLQAQLYVQIFYRMFPRNHVMTPTRWGKSLTIALALLDRCTSFPEKWACVAGTKEKAAIIMDYVIEHIFDSPDIMNQFQVENGEDLDYVRRHRSKSRITFMIPRPGGEHGVPLLSELFIQTAADALGHGAQNIIEDESALIDDNDHSLVMRMLGDDPAQNFLVKISNPFFRNHFYKSFKDERYHKFIVTVDDAIAEGRLTRDFIEEMRQQPNFGVLYGDHRGPEFPDASAIDASGYSPLITDEELSASYYQVPHVGDMRMGVDVAGEGTDFTSIVLRSDTAATLVFHEHTPDTMIIPGHIERIAKLNNVIIDDRHIFVDKTGIGDGLCKRLNEIYPGNNFGVSAGSTPEISAFYPNEWANDAKGHQISNFLNVRAQWAWRMVDWVRKGGKLWPKGQFSDMLDLKYKVQSDKKIKLKSKDEMRKDGARSPDVSDALALTFSTNPIPKRKPLKENPWKPLTKYGV